jgi:hypothetical protein
MISGNAPAGLSEGEYMFQDPLTAVMAMLLLCFMGILVMFLFVVRWLSSRNDELRETFRKQQLSLADIERQLMDMSFALRKLQSGDSDAAASNAAMNGSDDTGEPRSSDLTSMTQADLMSLLENAGRQKGATLRFDDQLLPPPVSAHTATEDYDPVNDPHLFEDSLLPESAYTSYRSRADKAKAGSSGNKHGQSLSIKLDD